jgi:hypothetical protein
MASPFKKYSNAVINIPIIKSGEYNPETMQYEDITTFQEYKVLLEPSKGDIRANQANAVLDINTLIMKGRLVNPQQFSPSIKFPVHCKVQLVREKQRGTMEISLTPLSPFFNEERLLGTPFIGTLVYE